MEKQTGLRTLGSIARIALFAIALLGSGAAGLAHAATIETDKDDYTPGETVIMFGSGWEPFETVELLLEEVPHDCNDRVFIAVADVNGDILNDDFLVEWHHFHMTFALTATGLSSGLVAETTFTDGLLADTIDSLGDSITRGFNAGSCTYGDQTDRNFSTGDNHGGNFCFAGSDTTYSHVERLECAKGGNVQIFNDAESGGNMRADFQNQATAARANLSGGAAPRYVTVLMGNNDACTNTTSKTGNGCGGDQDPNNYCRTTDVAFEREFREGMDQLIQVPSARVLVSAVVRASLLCNFGSKSTCGIGSIFGSCTNLWQGLSFIGDTGVCRSLTENCSNQRRIDMYNTTVGYNAILEAVTAEYAAIPVGGASANGAVKAADVAIRFTEAPFYYKFTSGEVSCCDCFHPSGSGQEKLAEGMWAGLNCATSSCCGTSADPLTNATCGATDTTSFYPGGFWAGNPCGNGIIDPGEQCDGGSTNGDPGSCCSGSCQIAIAGTVCRAAVGPCDAAETCNGSSTICPADAFATTMTTCRPSAGVCDLPETCSGSSTTCPADAKSTAECRGAAGSCDVAETCNGVSNGCPVNTFQPSTFECRAAAGVCDLAESCTGVSAFCPIDVKRTTECRASTGVCDVAESCNGSSVDCPADGFRSSTFVCRGSAGACDVAETCTGSSAACPADALASSGTVCRGAAGVCDVAESCDGVSTSCPADAKSTAECRAVAGPCDVAETCNGVGNACPADTFVSSSVECRASAGVCDVAESCTGSSATCPVDAKSAAQCRAAIDVCDVAESCDGVGNVCPPDVLAVAGTECRGVADLCDVAELCDGATAACPADTVAASGTECRGVQGVCDVAESCDGASIACPADAKSTVECRASAGICDVAESCDGIANNCPTDVFEPSTVECRASVDQCDAAESCTGTGAECPGDGAVSDGTTCDDGAACTTPDTCVSGQCQGNAQICGDGTLQGGCGELCDDGNLLDGDGCSSSCQIESTPGCGVAPASGCRAPVQVGKAQLQLKDKTPDTKDSLLWKWTKGEVTTKADFGTPTTTTSYQLCIYDGTTLVSSSAIPAAGLCAGRPCWSESSSGFKYLDKDATPDGITKITLKQGLVAGKPKIILKGKGANLAVPTLPLAQPVTVQLRNNEGVCWEAVYSAPATKNDPGNFKDKSD